MIVTRRVVLEPVLKVVLVRIVKSMKNAMNVMNAINILDVLVSDVKEECNRHPTSIDCLFL